MNKYDESFFSKYIQKNDVIIDVAHKHVIVILTTIILNYFFWVLVPTFLYYNSLTVQWLVPFFVLEILIISIFVKNAYDIFDWYNDVWIISEQSVTELNWALFSSNSTSVQYNSIEWLEITQEWIINSLIWKWDLQIHKIGWENNFHLPNAARCFDVIKLIEEIRATKKKAHSESNKEQNFETLLAALSGVVDEYMWKNWYTKENDQDMQGVIEKLKKSKHTIDLSE